MRLSCVLVLNLALAGMGGSAVALDATHTLHHTKTTHLIQPQHATRHAGVPAAAAHGTARPATAHSAASAGHSSRSLGSRNLGNGAATIRRVRLGVRRHRYFERFTASSFAMGNIFADDVTTGEDPIVRQAAIEALGDMNGTAVVINPANGRILAMV